MTSPILSIIIPVYNVVPFIKRCLESVAHQTFQDYELIVIDDGSTDGSGDICKQFADKNSQTTRYIYKNNEGLGPTRDFGVNLAKGKYITFLDADDWWEPGFCELMVDAIDKLDSDIAVCDINYLEGDPLNPSSTVSEIRLPELTNIIPSEFPDSINRMRTFFWGKVFRRTFYTESGLKQPAHKFEDFPVTPALVALSRSVCRVNRPMYFYYRCRKGSTTNYASSLGYIADSIKEMAENFKKLQLFDSYYLYIEKMAFSQVRFALNRMDVISPSCQEQQKQSLQQSLFRVMKDYFPGWINPYGINVAVYGSETLKKIVSNFLFKDPDCKMDSEKRYTYVFTDLLNNKADVTKSNLSSFEPEKFVVVRLLEAGREDTLKQQYNELVEYLPRAIEVSTEEVCIANGHMGESAIWNTADLIWYKLFSGYTLKKAF